MVLASSYLLIVANGSVSCGVREFPSVASN